MQAPGSTFLHEQNPQLAVSPEVTHTVEYLRAHGERIPNQPAAKISAYLGFLADSRLVDDGILSGNPESIERQVEAHVIQPEDVPENYFRLQQRIAREQGHGTPKLTPELRGQLTESVQSEQRAGLRTWADYLNHNSDAKYPDWFRFYAWSSLTRLGAYDKVRVAFQKRSRSTATPYPELNQEALAYVYDALDTARIQGKQVDGGPEMQKLLQTADFGKLYAHALHRATAAPERRDETRGAWVKFDQTHDPEVGRRLATSLQGHGTGWCTAGESIARAQLQGGDFYVYYTKDKDGMYTIPRLAIRMENGVVAEVRGVAAAQAMEPNMIDAAGEKLQELPGGEEYVVKANDMRRVTELDKRLADDPGATLSDDEIRFLYELDRDVVGFGYTPDPRLHELRVRRGGRDKLDLIRLIPETIREQLQSAFTAYATVARQLGKRGFLRRKSEAPLGAREFTRLFHQKDQEWRQNGVYDYAIEQFMTTGARYTVVATPNVQASQKQIITLINTFAKGQATDASGLQAESYAGMHYGAEACSGSRGAELVRFGLISSKGDAALGYLPVAQQQELLSQRQAASPDLHLRVPSLLDAITYWYALRAKGVVLRDDPRVFEQTYIRHFDLEPYVALGRPVVSVTEINSAGQPILTVSSANIGRASRLIIG